MTRPCCMALLGGRSYNEKAEVITPYFGSSGTGQINAIFPVVPSKPCSIESLICRTL